MIIFGLHVETNRKLINLRVISTTYYLYKTSSRITRLSNNIPCFHFKQYTLFSLQTIYPVFTSNITFFSKSLSTFKKSILQIIRPSPSSTYNWYNNKGIKHITRLRLGLRLNPMCICGMDIDTTCHCLLHCLNISNERFTLLNIASTIIRNSLHSCDATIVKLLLYGDESFDLVTNTLKINASVGFILSSKRFDRPLT